MEIRRIPITDIRRAAYNPRKTLTPSDPAYQRMKKSVATFGLVEPLVWNEFNQVLVGGHQRLSLMENEFGAVEVDVSVVHIENDRDEKALNLALNKHSGEWDFVSLADLMAELDVGDFDMEVTGFAAAELEQLATWTPGGIAPDAPAGPATPGDPKKLADRFMLPPFSVLNAREGWWQERKKAWIALGIESERGRGGGMGDGNAPGGSKMPGVSPTTGKIVRTDSHARAIEAPAETTLGAIPPNERSILKRKGNYNRK